MAAARTESATPLEKVPVEVIGIIFGYLSKTWAAEQWPTEFGGPVGSWYGGVVALPTICRALHGLAEQALFSRVNVSSISMLISIERHMLNRPQIASFIRTLTFEGFWEDLPMTECHQLFAACQGLQELICPARLLCNIEGMPNLDSVLVTINERESVAESQAGLLALLESRASLCRLRIAFVGQPEREYRLDLAAAVPNLRVEHLELFCWFSGWMSALTPAVLVSKLVDQPRSLSLHYCELSPVHWQHLAEAACDIKALCINAQIECWCDGGWPGHVFFPRSDVLALFKRLDRFRARKADLAELAQLEGTALEHIRYVTIV